MTEEEKKAKLKNDLNKLVGQAIIDGLIDSNSADFIDPEMTNKSGYAQGSSYRQSSGSFNQSGGTYRQGGGGDYTMSPQAAKSNDAADEC